MTATATAASAVGTTGGLWVMLADATRARAVTPNAQGDYGTVVEMDASVKPKSGGSITHTDSFMEEVARYIGENDGKFDRLVLVAPDIVLTELQEALVTSSKVSSEKIIGTMAKDLTATSNQDLRPFLKEYESSSSAA